MLLKKFTVKNYKAFKDSMTIDFSKTRNYDDLDDSVKPQVDSETRIAKHILLYGYNGIGKSSLCLAIMDMAMHLSDNERIIDGAFFNLDNFKPDSRNNYAKFEYVFDHRGSEIVYRYTKSDVLDLAREELIFNGKYVFRYSYGDLKDDNIVNIPGLEHLAFADLNTKNSMLRFLFTAGNYSGQGIGELVSFAEKMLYFRSSSEGNRYAGFEKGKTAIFDDIAARDLTSDFQSFIKNADLPYQLANGFNPETGGKTIAVRFKGGLRLIDSIASSGTKTLGLFYYWLQRMKNASLVIADEFDAYYHDKLAVLVYSIISKQNAQTITTTHNTNLLSYEHCRPDCIYVINQTRIENLSTIAQEHGIKEIRRGNNLRNLYCKFSEEGGEDY